MVCTLRKKYFDFAQDACVPWKECQEDEDLQTMSNTCLAKPPSVGVCEIRGKYFDATQKECVTWNVCQPVTH